MSRDALPPLAVLTLGLALASTFLGDREILQAAQPPAVFVSVVTAKGMPVTDLKASQVTLMVDGKPCPSFRIEPIDWPMKLQVLVDNGGAMRDSLPALKEALRAFFDEVPEGVETSLVTFAPQPQFLVPRTTDPRKVVEAIDRLAVTSGGAKFIEAASEASARVARTDGNFFHAMMVLTTNGPEESRGNIAGMVSRIQEQISDRPVTAHVLMLALGEQPGSKLAGAAAQTQVGVMLTTATRGTYESVNAVEQLPAAMREFGKKIARSNLLQTHQYRVSCEKSSSKSPRMALSISRTSDVLLVLTSDGHIP